MIANSSIADCPLPNSIEHTINLEPGTKPAFRLLFNLLNRKLKVLRDYLGKVQKNS